MKNDFTQTFALLRFQLRQKWLWLSLWLLGLTAFAGGYVPAFEKIAEDQGKVGLFVTMQNPAMTAIVGPLPVDVANNYTVGVMYGHEMTLFIAVVTMMIAGSFMIEQTRKTEENGQLEILKSLRIGARAYSMAAILLVLMHTILMVALISGILVSYQVETVDLAGSSYFASTIGLASLLGASLAYVCAQIFPTSSQARGIFFSIVGLLYLFRASTDVSNLDFSKINPLAWTYLGQPFLRNNLNYTSALLVLTLVLFLVGMKLESQRDLGASLLAARKGKTQAKGYLTTPLGFIFYLNKGTIIAWFIADVIIALMYGSIYGDIDTFVNSNELISQMFANDASSLTDSFTSLIMVVMTAIGLVMPLVVVRKVHTEEAKSRLGYLVVHRVSRGKIYLSTLFLSLVFGLLAIVLNGISLGVAAVSSMKAENYDFVWTCLKAAMNQWPLVWLFVGLMLLSLSLPAVFGWLVYGLLGYSFCVTYFAVLLDLPKWVVHTSLFDLLAKMPMDKFALAPFIGLSVAGIVAMVIGWCLFTNKEIKA
ncbi:ABC transporter permease [Enterococcus cecorum]|uniref:ABC transporter permease n=1 Tax=Enterococcus cecorum TaxID=44008 RepID=UPI000DE9162E|nr:ABC transporter permease [Enterococcus cecorum]